MMNYSFFSKVVLFMSFLLGLSGCANGIKGGDYLNREPAFVIEQFFKGDIKAWGSFKTAEAK